MKRLLFLVLLFIPVLLVAQDSTTTLTYQNCYSTTMTGTKDTLDVTWGSNRTSFNYYMITAKSSATDTLRIWTLGENGFTWSPCGVTGITTGTTAAFINATTTEAKYILTDPLPVKIRIIDESHDGATCVISVSAVYSTQ
jgi:hypothetical protein